MKKTMICLAVIAGMALLVSGCGAAPEPEPGPVTAIDQMVGVYYRVNAPGYPDWYIEVLEDGTIYHSKWLERLEEGPWNAAWETSFEGAQLVISEYVGPCDDSPTALYEVHRLENGNLRFIPLEDECNVRVAFMYGPEGSETAEYEPVQ